MATRHTRIVERAIARLKLKQLRLLVAVGRYGSIQHAARELRVSQPAATKMVQDLEADFDVKLFDRTNRGVIPTEFGHALIRHGKLILAQVSNAAQELDDLSEGSSGRVVIGTLLAAASNLLPDAIDSLLAERPRVAVKVIEGTNDALMPALFSGEIDLVVGRLSSYRHRAKLVQEKLFDERILVVAGNQHPLAGSKSLTFSQLTPFGWILPPGETTLRRQVDQFFMSQGQYVPSTVLESVSYLTNRSLLTTRNLVGLMPEHVATHDIERGTLVELRWPVPFGKGPVGVSHRGGEFLSPAASAFIEALRRVALKMKDV